MVRNGIFNTAGALIRASVGLITGPILSRFMGLEEYGVWALISSILAFLSVVESGLSNTTTVFLSKDLNDRDNLKISQDITISLIFMLVLATLASLLLFLTAETLISLFTSLDLDQRKNSTLALQIGSFSIFFQLMQQIFIGVEQAYQNYQVSSLLKTIQFTLFGFGWIGIANLGGGSVALTIWQVIISLLVLVLHIFVFTFLTREGRFQFSWSQEKAVSILQYSLVMWTMTLGGVLFTRGDRIIVGLILGAERLGIYSIVSDIASGINFIVNQPLQPLLPAISGFSSFSLDHLQNKLIRLVQLNSCMASWSGSLVLILSPFAIKFAIPLDLVAQATALRCVLLLSVITVVQSLCNVGYYLLMANDVTYLTSLLFTCGSLSLVLIYLGSLKFGLIGAIIGNLFFSMMIICTPISLQKYGIKYGSSIFLLTVPISLFLLICFLNSALNISHFTFSFFLILQSVLVAIWLLRVKKYMPKTCK